MAAQPTNAPGAAQPPDMRKARTFPPGPPRCTAGPRLAVHILLQLTDLLLQLADLVLQLFVLVVVRGRGAPGRVVVVVPVIGAHAARAALERDVHGAPLTAP